MLSRRLFLKSLCLGLSGLTLAPSFVVANPQKQTLPILMFHKVLDEPTRPEDISPSELSELFQFLFENNYRPINITDIINTPEKIAQIFAEGFKPFAVTADDAHSSLLFSQNNACTYDITTSLPNQFSFLEIYTKSAKPYNISPKATFFISESIEGVYDKRNYQRASKATNKYFGDFIRLPAVLDLLENYSGIELGYHTCEHIFMGDKNAKETHDILAMQMNAFKEMGVFDKIKPLFAYPYGYPPSPEGIEAIKDLGFIGAVLAFPGVNEAKYKTIPLCEIDAEYQLVNDTFFIPRTNIGSYIYAPPNPNELVYKKIDPIEDLRKDFNI